MAATIARRYTYNAFVQLGSTAQEDVRIWAVNSTGAVVIDSTTDSSGNIPATKVEAASYSVSGFVTTESDRNPFNIRALSYGLEVEDVSQNISSSSTGNAFFASINAGLTSTDKVAVAAYDNVSIAHATSTGLVTVSTGTLGQVDTAPELYDFLQVEAVDNPQVGRFRSQLMTTVDTASTSGMNFRFAAGYSLVVNNLLFDGQFGSLTFQSSDDNLTIEATSGNVQDYSITGDVFLSTGTAGIALDNLDVSGTLDFGIAGASTSYSLTDCQVGTVFSTSSGVVILAGGDTTIGTNGSSDNIEIINTKTLLVTVQDEAAVAIENARVGIYDNPRTPSQTELMNKLTNASGIATEAYNYVSDTAVEVRVRKGSAGATKYEPINSPQTITVAGLTVTITLNEDPNNAS